MDIEIPEKTYFRIGEVSKILGVEPYVVRYWESEFSSIKPIRTKSEQRLYRRKDLEELVLIQRLLYRDKFTIAGAKKKLQELRRESPSMPGAEEECREKLRSIRQELEAIRDLLRGEGS
jgi:DNA-binding transcriptional MerR regulator